MRSSRAIQVMRRCFATDATARYESVPSVVAPMTMTNGEWLNGEFKNISLPLIKQVCGDDAAEQTPITRSDALRDVGIYVDHERPVHDARGLGLTVENDNIQLVPMVSM